MPDRAPHDVVFLFDFDRTLFDSDRLKAEFSGLVEGHPSGRGAGRFWEIYEEVRRPEDVVDWAETIRRYALECPAGLAPLVASELTVSLWAMPFRDLVFASSVGVLRELSAFGPTVVVSDGVEGFQRHKIVESGIAEAVGERVLVYGHKEQRLDAIARLFPAERYVFVDDKRRILRVAAAFFGPGVTTVLVADGPSEGADIVIAGIVTLVERLRERGVIPVAWRSPFTER